MSFFNPFSKLFLGKGFREKLNVTLSIFVGEDDRDDPVNNFVGLFDYLTLFIPYTLQHIPNHFLEVSNDRLHSDHPDLPSSFAFPFMGFMVGAAFFMCMILITVRYVLGLAFVLALSPFTLAAHVMDRTCIESNVEEMETQSTHAKYIKQLHINPTLEYKLTNNFELNASTHPTTTTELRPSETDDKSHGFIFSTARVTRGSVVKNR